MSSRRGSPTVVAAGQYFNNAIAGLPGAPKTTQKAIESVSALALSASKSFTQFSYGGNAGSGRYLEFFAGIPTNEAPLRVVSAYSGITIVARTTATSATCTLEFRDIAAGLPGTLLYTVTFSAVKEVVLTSTPSSPLFTTGTNAQIVCVVASGSISKPHLYVTGQGG